MSSSVSCAMVALSPSRYESIRRHEGCDAAFHQITLTTCYYYAVFNAPCVGRLNDEIACTSSGSRSPCEGSVLRVKWRHIITYT